MTSITFAHVRKFAHSIYYNGNINGTAITLPELLQEETLTKLVLFTLNSFVSSKMFTLEDA